ncbi:MAG TPA: IS4 family transposase [Chloroflexota bacterium]
MARARGNRRAGGGGGGSLVDRRLRRWLTKEMREVAPLVAAGAAACAADRYRKHFTARQHTWLLLFHGLTRQPSLRQSYAAFAQCDGLLAASGLAAPAPAAAAAVRLGVSYSQFAASNTSRPPAFLAALFAAVLQRVRRGARADPLAPPPELCLLDATFFRGCLRLAPWAPTMRGRRRRAAVRVQVEYTPAQDLPEHVLVQRGQPNDCRGLDAAILDHPDRLAELEGRTLIFDLGFYSHARFARLLAAGVHLVTRLHPQAAVTVLEQRPLPQPFPGLPAGRIALEADQHIRLGSAHNRRGAVLPDLRLVTATVAPTPVAARHGAHPVRYRVLTDRWDRTPQEVVQFYLWRWLIESFFRWLKRVVNAVHLLGESPEATELSVWLALVVHLLCLLAAQALDQPGRSPALLAQFPVLFGALTPDELAAATDHPPPPIQLPLPDLLPTRPTDLPCS